MKYILIILLFYTSSNFAQDKVIYNDGKIVYGKIISIGSNVVYFKNSDSSEVQQIEKSNLIFAEISKSKRYVFKDSINSKNISTFKLKEKKHFIGIQPLGVFVGRINLIYERLSANQKVGFVLPISITFDPNSIFYKIGRDSTRNNIIQSNKKIGIITGFDVNFYLGQKATRCFFIGPRFRYGNNLFIENFNLLTFQTQIGWRFQKPVSPFVQHLSFGFGLAKISIALPRPFNTNPIFSWFSLNYRLGINW